jgi:hypothetical protein
MSSGSKNNSPKSQTNGHSNSKKKRTTKNSDSEASPRRRRATQNSKQHSAHTAVNKDEMARFVLWRRPVQTVYYFALELVEIIIFYFLKFLSYRKVVAFILLASGLVTAGFYTDGSHLDLLVYFRKKTLWCMYWMGLGIASSIGLGTGLHTFLLYLGPFIAEVTLAAYECESLNFPEPPYPDEIVCPSGNETALKAASLSILSIMAKVRLESFMWGAGTAIGELPPYFMARASALSSFENRKQSSEIDEELEEFEQLLKAEKEGTAASLSLADRMRMTVFKVIKKVGFWGILLCASIPNPLFDLAGITCGHFLVNFWTFFGATLIGKAIIKMHMQKVLVIFLFSEHHLNNVLELLARLPYVGASLQPLIQDWLNSEKNKLHMKSNRTDGQHVPSESMLGWLLGKLVMCMILFFVVSIVNSLAQQRYKRLSTRASSSTTIFVDEPVKKKVAND